MELRQFLHLTMILGVSRSESISPMDFMRFPAGFKLGVATASHQIEGAWNVSDKGVNVWDRFTHRKPSPIIDGSTGDVACDSYNKYKEDVALLRELGVDYYRMSLSWSRILPNGFANKISNDGLRYYRNLLDDLLADGIEPVVTIYHWDHPDLFEDMGGWTNELMVTWFVDYARVVFNELGDRIKTYVTINEPTDVCEKAYGTGEKAPGKVLPGIGPYLCMHNMLKAHAAVYRMYEREFRSRQKGKIGLLGQCMSYYPKYPDDDVSPEVQFDFLCGWMAEPIFGAKGDYPEVMKRRIAENSRLEGYPRSRLPVFSEKEIEDIRGSADFFGLNHYTSMLTEVAPKSHDTLWYEDTGVIKSRNENWPRDSTSWLRIFPPGLGDVLRTIKKRYGNPPVYVLENGMSDVGNCTNDTQRVEFLHDYLRELLLAVNRDGCNVQRYAAWSLLDNFEWQSGYKDHFGLVHVDFQNPSRTRTRKLSYEWYKKVIQTRTLQPKIVSHQT